MQTTTEHPIGTWKFWRFGLISREIYRESEDSFEINDTSSGWTTCTVNQQQMNALYAGELSLLDLNFE